MRVLIGCARSGVMARAFRARGWEAWEVEDDHPSHACLHICYGESYVFLNSDNGARQVSHQEIATLYMHREEAMPDAQFIVEACNSHDALLTELREVKATFDDALIAQARAGELRSSGKAQVDAKLLLSALDREVALGAQVKSLRAALHLTLAAVELNTPNGVRNFPNGRWPLDYEGNVDHEAIAVIARAALASA